MATGRDSRDLRKALEDLLGEGGLAGDAGNAASGGGGVGGGLLSMIGGANNSYFGALIAALIGTAASITPAILPLAGGLGFAGGTGLLAGSLASANPKLPGAAEFTKMEKKLEAALMPAPMVLKPLAGLMNQLGSGITKLQPQLSSLFNASMPGAKLFIGMMLQAAKIILPSFTQALKELKPELPTIMQGFVYLAQGVATFMKNLGPGMKDSAIVFKGLMAGVGDVLGFLGRAFSDLANYIVKWAEKAKVDAHQFAEVWDVARHDIANVFDGMRHDIAHIWDSIWNDTYGTEVHGWHNVENAIDDARHEISNVFDGIRHDIAHWWDVAWSYVKTRFDAAWHDEISGLNGLWHDITTAFDNIRHTIATVWDNAWNDIINAGKRFAGTVIGGWVALGKGIWNAVRHIPGQLWNLGKSALTELENGMKSVWTGLWGWLKNTVGGIVGKVEHFLHMSPPHPGSAFFDLGANMMKHLEAGVKSKVGAVQGAIHGSMRAIGGSATGWIEQAMNLVHAPKSWLPALERLVSLESGGNPRAVDPEAVDGQHATGLWQMLPSTFAAHSAGGSIWNPVSEGVSALRYIMQQYGSPFNIPGLMTGHYVGYAKGGWINEPVFGLGTKSGSMYGIGENGPEYVSPHGSGGGVTVVVNANGLVNPSAIANEIWLELRNLKRTRGGQALGLN